MIESAKSIKFAKIANSANYRIATYPVKPNDSPVRHPEYDLFGKSRNAPNLVRDSINAKRQISRLVTLMALVAYGCVDSTPNDNQRVVFRAIKIPVIVICRGDTSHWESRERAF